MSKVKEEQAEDLFASSEEEKIFTIKEASLKDDFCNYKFEILRGVGSGDTHSVNGSGIIEDDMRDAFARLNVHLATIDDVFKLSGIELDNIDDFHNHELTSHYHVTGFKIKGSKENESIILIGSKFVGTAGGRIELATPKIPLDNLSSYQWYNELKKAADDAREEVELYKEGKYTAVEEKEEKPNTRQLTIGDEIKQAQEATIEDDFAPSAPFEPSEEEDDAFANAKV
jgi:hypothetical protein